MAVIYAVAPYSYSIHSLFVDFLYCCYRRVFTFTTLAITVLVEAVLNQKVLKDRERKRN
jgi:hypothetical protein